jgi:hypothetical protein
MVTAKEVRAPNMEQGAGACTWTIYACLREVGGKNTFRIHAEASWLTKQAKMLKVSRGHAIMVSVCLDKLDVRQVAALRLPWDA